jgi:cardiolipin synthase A/B
MSDLKIENLNQQSNNFNNPESNKSFSHLNSEKIKLFSNSDIYWEKLWAKIDKAEKYIFMMTYDIDNKMIANLTIRKLMEAQERGVQVVLIMEHLNFYMKHSLYKQLKKKGVVIIKPNPMHKIFYHMRELNTRKFFNRCHQKVTLVDDDLFLGSINVAEEYSSFKYGSNSFIDLNIFVKKTICKPKILKFFEEFIEDCDEQLKPGQKELMKNIFSEAEQKYTPFSNNKIESLAFEEFLEEKPPVKSEIQDNIYDLLDSSKESITIIQPYYATLKKVEDILIKAIKRGVKVKIITAEKRDQTAYKYIYNNDLFKNLLENGVEVYEFLDKLLHMKAYYVDNKTLSIGSLNNDRTSFIMNNEANYLIKKNPHNEQFFTDFESMVCNLDINTRRVMLNTYKNPFRLAYSYWWYFFLWGMEKLAPNRKPKYLDD